MFPSLLHAGQIANYRPVFRPCTDQHGRLTVAIREYEQGGGRHLLLVDPLTLDTSPVPASTCRDIAPAAGTAQLAATPFITALNRHTSHPHRLQNDGATAADLPLPGCILTVDLCPSQAPFEKGMFEALPRLPQKREGPVPVAIAVTGRWLETHPAELAWLADEARGGRLAITWVNHSWHHPYQPGTPLSTNFLLTPGTDLDAEVLRLEQALLERGLTPSVFFRFPGLVSNGRLIARLRELSLIPLGSNAWLAKGETPRPGSFILVHGNGNEPKGIRVLMELLETGAMSRLSPLEAAFAGVMKSRERK